MTDSQNIHASCRNGDIDNVKLLLQEKCNIEARDENDLRPIHVACDNGQVGIVKLLLGEQCDIEARDKNGWRPIHFGSKLGSVEIIKLLIDHQCDMNASTKDDKSPLNIATEFNHEQLINVLKYELFKEKLILKIKKASEVECHAACDHKSCQDELIQNKTLIGSGAYGKVYKLIDPETNFEYALKLIKIDKRAEETEVRGIEKNINKYRDVIKHLRIVQYFGSIVRSPRMYIFREFFPKGSIEDEIQIVGYLPEQRIVRYTKQILEALEFLHNKKVIHRNIKPRKFLLDDNDNVKLCDFGLSKTLSSISSDSESNDRKANTFCGTMCYMAPELIIGEGYGFSVDIWSVGASIVHMLTGKPPYYDMHQPAILLKICMNKKIEFEPVEPMSDNMKSFMKEILNPDPVKRLTAKALLKYLTDHAMI